MYFNLLTGSPFLVRIAGEPSGRLTERNMRQSEATFTLLK